ncbi:MAG: methionyl-tRNA formyltransferase [Alphaproteobacteria bacterium]|nr:MAG: methionyl-tRNA formyltransferase [Alphaproteobacteria bacterium]
MPLRLAFMGTPEFSVPVLQALLASEHEVVAVYSQPPRKAGRGHKVVKSPVHQCAEAAGIAVYTPLNFKDPADLKVFEDLNLDAAVVVAYGLLLPEAILTAPRYGCLNIHASLLPRWRGAAPIQRAIMAGDTKTGLMTMQMEKGLDTGPIYDTEEVMIGADETAGELHDRLCALGGPLILKTLSRLPEGAQPTAQAEEGAVYAAKIDKGEAQIDWRRPAEEIARQVCGLSPFPGAWTSLPGSGDRLKVLKARATAGNGEPGTHIAAPFTIACGQGALEILEVQRAGKGPCSAEDFARGFQMGAEDRLGAA